MEIISTILGVITLVGVLALIAAYFYRVRSKDIIATLKDSNDAYSERVKLLEEDKKRTDEAHKLKISELEGRLSTLERMKTPPLQPLIEMVHSNHLEVMRALTKG